MDHVCSRAAYIFVYQMSICYMYVNICVAKNKKEEEEGKKFRQTWDAQFHLKWLCQIFPFNFEVRYVAWGHNIVCPSSGVWDTVCY